MSDASPGSSARAVRVPRDVNQDPLVDAEIEAEGVECRAALVPIPF